MVVGGAEAAAETVRSAALGRLYQYCIRPSPEGGTATLYWGNGGVDRCCNVEAAMLLKRCNGGAAGLLKSK